MRYFRALSSTFFLRQPVLTASREQSIKHNVIDQLSTECYVYRVRQK